MDLIIHHKDCPDGFCAAFIASKVYPEAKLLARDHGLEPPYDEVVGKDVLVVDFSWRTRHQNQRMFDLSKSFRILDHHKTAQSELTGLPFALFDMNRSGAGIASDELLGRRPWYVDYVEDRDLWRFLLPDSKEINAYIMTLPHTLESWSILDNISPAEAKTLGQGALRQIDHYVEKAVSQRLYGKIGDYSACFVNAQYMNISEVGNALCDFAEIGGGWFERGDGMMQFSLRSRGDIDVSIIAKKYNGGGHKNAAGFQLPLVEGRKVIDSILNRHQ